MLSIVAQHRHSRSHRTGAGLDVGWGECPSNPGLLFTGLVRCSLTIDESHEYGTTATHNYIDLKWTRELVSIVKLSTEQYVVYYRHHTQCEWKKLANRLANCMPRSNPTVATSASIGRGLTPLTSSPPPHPQIICPAPRFHALYVYYDAVCKWTDTCLFIQPVKRWQKSSHASSPFYKFISAGMYVYNVNTVTMKPC